MSNSDLHSLAERVERATEYDQQPLIWDAAIAVSCAGDHLRELLDAGAFLDAAMMLVPEGPHGSHWGLNSHDRRNGKACAYVTLYDLPVGDDQSPSVCEAATTALALCAAALKARASQ